MVFGSLRAALLSVYGTPGPAGGMVDLFTQQGDLNMAATLLAYLSQSDEALAFVRDNVERGTLVHTDGWPSYASLGDEGYVHRPVVQSRTDNPAYLPHVHLIISNLKTWLQGTHHGRVKPKHLQAYLNEFTFRFNRRFWREPAIRRALALMVQTDERPTYRSLYASGTRSGWQHPNSHLPLSGLSTGENSGRSAPDLTG